MSKAVDRKPYPTRVPGSQSKTPTDPKDPLRIQDLGNVNAYQRDATRAGRENSNAFRNATVERIPTGFQGAYRATLGGMGFNDPRYTVGGNIVSMQGKSKPKTKYSWIDTRSGGGRGVGARKSAHSTMTKGKKKPARDDMDMMREIARESAPAAPMPKVKKGQGAYTEHIMTKGKKKKGYDDISMYPGIKEDLMATRKTSKMTKKLPPPPSKGGLSSVGAAPPGWWAPGGQGTMVGGRRPATLTSPTGLPPRGGRRPVPLTSPTGLPPRGGRRPVPPPISSGGPGKPPRNPDRDGLPRNPGNPSGKYESTRPTTKPAPVGQMPKRPNDKFSGRNPGKVVIPKPKIYGDNFSNRSRGMNKRGG